MKLYKKDLNIIIKALKAQEKVEFTKLEKASDDDSRELIIRDIKHIKNLSGDFEYELSKITV